MNINPNLSSKEITQYLNRGYEKLAEEHNYVAELLMPKGLRELEDDWNYGKYVTKHKYNVYTAGRDMGLPRWQLFKHDLSKYKPSEFVPYRKWFQGPKGLTGTNDRDTYLEWREAVDKHYTHPMNMHHWRKRGLTPSEVPMDIKLESVADWYSVAKTNKRTDEQFKNWFYRNKDRLPIDNLTKEEIDRRLS